MKLQKRILTAVLALIMMLPLFLISASAADKKITRQASAVNDVRGEGMLIIYTPDFGPRTNTNPYGFEAVIENNRVISLNKYNSKIPENGFVISGHDANNGNAEMDMGKWIQANVQVGDYVYFNPANVITVSSVELAEQAFYDITMKYDAINGPRYADTVVIYDKKGTRTGTNEWGYEITVTGGIVTALGGYDSLIPNVANSFVVSAHGVANVQWLQRNVLIGMGVTYKDNVITFSYNDQSELKGLEVRLNTLKSDYNAAIKRYDNFDFATVKSELDAMEKLYNQTKADYSSGKIGVSELVAAGEKFTESEEKVSVLMCESKTVEYRGVWIRPTQTSARQVEKMVQELYDNGINTICIETIYDSTTIMPMPEDCLFECNPKFDHFDMLEAYIEECHERDMELHLWLPIFYVGDYYGTNVERSVATKKPEWLSVSNTGKYSYQLLPKGTEGAGLMMLDPANPEACDYLLGVYKYILEKYDVDGIQLDYIRYYTRSADGLFDMGYNKHIVDAFKAKYKVEPKADPNHSYWNKWVQFRCDYVTAFVERMRKLVDDVAPDVLIGADVGPDAAETRAYNYQDFYTWLDKGWLDILFPMSYGYGYEAQIAEQIKKCGDDAFIAVGLGIFMEELKANDMKVQAMYNNSVYANGSVYFEATAYLNKNTGKHLLESVYRNKAITPSYDIVAAAKAQVEFAKDRINSVILPLDAVSEDGAAMIISALDAISASFTAEGYDKTLVENLPTVIGQSNIMSDAGTRIINDVNLAIKGYSVRLKNTNVSGDLPDVSDVVSGVESDIENNSDTTSSAGTDTTGSSAADNSADDSDSSNTVMIICIIVLVVAVVAGAVVIVVVKKKGK